MARIGSASAGEATRGSARRRAMATVVLVAAALGLGGCGTWADPTEWNMSWADPTEWFSDDPPPPPPAGTQPAAASSGDRFPNLARVPARPVEVSSTGERRQAIDSLAADRANARYTDEELRARPADSNAPPPMPRAPVTQLPTTGQTAQPRAAVAPVQQPGSVALQPPGPTQPVGQRAPGSAASMADTFAASLAQSSATSLPANLAQPGAAAGTAPGQFGSPGFASMAPGQPGGTQLLAVIRFANGEAKLGNDDRALVRRVAEYYKGVGGKGVLRVVGFASSRTGDMDASQHRQLNFALSQRRADLVAAELRRRGLDTAQVRAEARADAAPVYYEAMPRAEDYNRRVEIYLAN